MTIFGIFGKKKRPSAESVDVKRVIDELYRLTGVTAYKLAKTHGISRTYVYSWATDKRPVTDEMKKRIARAVRAEAERHGVEIAYGAMANY